jgi:hypothetical protein
VDQDIHDYNYPKQNKIPKHMISNSQNESINHVESNKMQMKDIEPNKNYNISSFQNLNNISNNGNRKKIFANGLSNFQPLDISNYRLKESHPRMSFPLNNPKPPNLQLANENEIYIPNQKSRNLEFKHINNSNLRKDNKSLSKKAFLSNNFLNIEGKKISSIGSSNNVAYNQKVYKNILDYLKNNNQMMQNIQKQLLFKSPNNARISDNILESQMQNLLTIKENSISKENMENFGLFNNILSFIKSSNFKNENILENKKQIIKYPFENNISDSNQVIDTPNGVFDFLNYFNFLNNVYKNKQDLESLKGIIERNQKKRKFLQQK